jgi:serine/threonine-protein kinase HipA
MKRLEVRLSREPGEERIVGQLAETGGQVVFEYDPAFLRDPLWLSPFKLPPQPGLIAHRDQAFGPIYRQLLEVTRILTRNHQDVLECYRRMVFNVLTHNRDDHVKNFAFRMTDEGVWELAPAYDLVFSPGPGGEHTMTVAGEGRAPARRHLLQLAAPAGISDREAESILDRVAAAAAHWPAHARQAGVRPKSAKLVENAITVCLARL